MKQTEINPGILFSTLILDWYDRSGRKLPWRETNEAYPILVSEIMLQQTQVSRVIPFFHRWMEQFPTWKDLAHAAPANVIRVWSGLGYNRRALILQAIAQAVEKTGVPKSEQEWLNLKGIGPYTAAALTVFALQKRAVPVDTNIRRIGARFFLGVPFPDAMHDPELRLGLTNLIQSTSRFSDLIQALFDLASLICLKKPLCSSCPFVQHCKAAPQFVGNLVEIPKASIKKPKEKRHPGKPYPDRIYRGRILREIGQRPEGILPSNLGPLIDPDFHKKTDTDWLKNMIGRLIADKLIVSCARKLFLP